MTHKLLNELFPNFTCVACGCEMRNSPNDCLCQKCMDALPFNSEIGDKNHSAPFAYEDPIKKMILSLKYSDNGLVARAVAPYMAAVFMKANPRTYKKFVLVPVPLCKSRERERGYNQSELLANEVARHAELPVMVTALQRIKKTAPQKKMTAEQRAENLAGAFAVPEPTLIKGKNILLIDDVYTTGATAREITKTLKSAGAKTVKVLTIAAAS